MDITKDEVEKVFQVNVFSHFWMLSEFLPELMSAHNGSGGHIVSLSSTAGLIGTPNLTSYCSSKFAITGLMETLQREYRQLHGSKAHLQITTVYPFIVNTGMAKKGYTRFPSLVPTTEPKEAVRIIIDGMRQNKRKIYIPEVLELIFSVNSILPHKLSDLAQDFVGAGVDPHND